MYTDATFDLVSAITAGRVPVRTLIMGPMANAYHKLLQEIDDVSNDIINAMCAFSEGGIGGIVGNKAWILSDKMNTPISYVRFFACLNGP